MTTRRFTTLPVKATLAENDHVAGLDGGAAADARALVRFPTPLFKSFGTIVVDGQPTLTAPTPGSTLTLSSGQGIALTTNPTGNGVLVSLTGEGGGDSGEADARSPSAYGYDIIIVAGQSNCYYGEGYDAVLDTPNPRIKQFGRNGGRDYQIVPAVEPLDFIGPDPTRIGFGLSLAKTYVERHLSHARDVLIIPMAQGSTGFSNNWWNPGNKHYKDMVARTKRALALQPNSRVVMLAWQQGEQDASDNITGAAYAASFDAFVAALYNDLGFASSGPSAVPMLLGLQVPYGTSLYTSGTNIQNAILAAPGRNPSRPMAVVQTRGLYGGVPNADTVHYEASSLRELGRRYCDVYGKVLDRLTGVVSGDVPQKITNIRALGRGGGITLAWDIPYLYQKAFTSYTIEYKLNSSNTWTAAPAITTHWTPWATINALTNGSVYNIRIRATNAAGAGPWSEVVNVTPTATPAAAAVFNHYANMVWGINPKYGLGDLSVNGRPTNATGLSGEALTEITMPSIEQRGRHAGVEWVASIHTRNAKLRPNGTPTFPAQYTALVFCKLLDASTPGVKNNLISMATDPSFSGKQILWVQQDGAGTPRLCQGFGNFDYSQPINNNEWYLLGVTRNSATGAWQLFIDGNALTSGTDASDATQFQFQFGAYLAGGGSDNNFYGEVGFLGLYNTILTASQQLAILNLLKGL